MFKVGEGLAKHSKNVQAIGQTFKGCFKGLAVDISMFFSFSNIWLNI
jgi:hypothetical protein